MNMKIRYIRLLAGLALAVFASSCQDDIDLNGGNGAVDYGDDFFILSDMSHPQSRVGYDPADINESYFESGDEVGVFALNDDNTPATGQPGNVKYVVHAVASNIDNPDALSRRVLRPATNVALPTSCQKYFFYYPYRDNITYDDLKEFTHSVQTDQRDKGKFTASDLLWDIATPQGKYCHIAMDHAMAQIIVQLDDRNYAIESGVTLSGLKISTQPFNIVCDKLEDMTYDVTGAVTENLNMWDFLYNSNGMRQYRFTIPAQKIEKGTKLISAYATNGNIKTFTLKNDMVMKPGYNYYFSISKKPIPIPNYEETDSWVLDVFDPESGKAVGLLCREYIRYQPNNHDGDDICEGPTTPSDEYGKPRINSQAWVFYKLQPGSQIPDLSKGQILRFISDLRINLDGSKGFKDYDDFDAGRSDATQFVNGYTNFDGLNKPRPNINNDRAQGLYMSQHGHGWKNYNKTYGDSSEDYAEYHMHGGTILWDGSKNEIIDFIMPEKNRIPGFPDCNNWHVVSKSKGDISPCNFNQLAYDNGHVAIDENGECYISYEPLAEDLVHDIQGKSVGVTFPHYLVDVRINNTGSIENIRYPLAKLGFNQFWMREDLRAKTLRNGQSIKCYNMRCEDPNYNNRLYSFIQNYDPAYPEITFGYIYFRDNNGVKDEDNKSWDPYNNEPVDELKIPPLYNYLCFYNEYIAPIATSTAAGISEYKRPTDSDLYFLGKYLGFMGVSKMMSNAYAPVNNGQMINGYRKSLRNKELILNYHGDALSYSGNVSGLNLRANANYYPDDWNQSEIHSGALCSFWLYDGELSADNNNYGLSNLEFYLWDSWNYLYGIVNQQNKSLIKTGIQKGAPNYGNGPYGDSKHSKDEYHRRLAFMPIRYFLKYKGNDGRIGSRKSPMSRLVGQNNDIENRNVYIQLCFD